MSRDTLAALAATVAVVAVVVLGFHFLGSPASQRLIQADGRTLQALSQLATQIQNAAHRSNNEVPANLDAISDTTKQSPATHKEFIYRPKSKSEFELCATFLAKSPDVPSPSASQTNQDPWVHPAGDHCFSFHLNNPVPAAPYFY